MKFHVILTLDYEIFGDGSGCLRDCVVKPSQQCLDVCDNYSVKQTFFVDALEFLAMEKVDLYPFYTDLEQQIRGFIGSGHSVQLHLHPQWLGAEYREKRWHLDFSKWRIGGLTRDQIDQAINKANMYFSNLIPEVASEINVFRAGGWAIQPAGEVLPVLSQACIRIDSTVAPGLFNFAKGDGYNFYKAPIKPFWYVSDDVCREDKHGSILEVPIATARIGFKKHVAALLESRKYSAFPPGCCGTYSNPNGRWQNSLYKISRLLTLGTAMLDYSTLPTWAMIELIKRYMEKFERSNCDVPIVAIGHNKNFTARSAENLDTLLSWLTKQDNVVFSDYDNFYKSLTR